MKMNELQKMAAIIANAISAGFEFQVGMSFWDCAINAANYIRENCDPEITEKKGPRDFGPFFDFNEEGIFITFEN